MYVYARDNIALGLSPSVDDFIPVTIAVEVYAAGLL
jgi:hypothetical protein